MKSALRWLALLTACGPSSPALAPDAGSVAVDPLSHAGPLDALGQRFARLRARLVDGGAREQLWFDRVLLLEREGVARPVDVATGRCTTFVALGGGGVRELDLSAYDGDGERAADDEVGGEGGLVRVCPRARPVPATEPYHLVLVARSGRGAAALGAFEEPDGLELHAAPLFDGLLAPEVPFRDVLARLADARASLRQRGFVEIFEPALERLAEGGLLRRSYPLRAGRCYVAVVDAAHGARDPDLFVLDPTGAEVARDLRPGAEARVEFCPEREGSHVFEVRLFEGAGAVALGLHEGPAPRVSRAVAAAPPRSEPGRDTALDEAVASRVQRGYVEQERFVTNAALRPGEQGAHDVVVGPGCVLVVGVASRPDTDLDLHLFEAAGELLDADTAVEPVARVGACATGPRRARVAVRVYGSPSPYALVTLRAPAAVADVTTLRLDTATDAVRARGMLPGSTGEARLEQGATHTLEMHVPAGRCTALAAAGPGATDDVDVTLARADGSIVASDTGPAPYALVRRCSAPQSDERLVATIRRYRGEGPVRFVQLVDPSP